MIHLFLRSAKGNVEIITQNAQNSKGFAQSLVEIIPKNPLDAAVRALDGEMLALMFCALFFGFAFYLYQKHTPEVKELKILQILEEIFNASLKIVELAMKLAPYAVFAIVFNTAFKFGLEIFESLLYFTMTVVADFLFNNLLCTQFFLNSLRKDRQ